MFSKHFSLSAHKPTFGWLRYRSYNCSGLSLAFVILTAMDACYSQGKSIFVSAVCLFKI